MFTSLQKDIRELATDDSGRLSLAKSMLAVGFVVITGIELYLTVSNQLTIEHLGLYAALVSGHSLTSKWIDQHTDTKPD